MFALPPLFALIRYRPSIETDYTFLEPYKNIAILIQTTMNADRSWCLHIVENPYSCIEDSIASYADNSPLFPNKVLEIPIRVDTDIRQIKMIFNNCILRSRDHTIPLLKISEPCEILGSRFYSLKDNEHLYFNLTMGIVTKDIVIKKKEIIPRHILDVYIQNLLATKETCPITGEEFTKDSIRITPGGHAMSISAERWIVDKGNCPVCRKSCSEFLG